MAGRVAVFNGNFRAIKNLDRLQARLAELPDRLQAPLLSAANASIDEFVTRFKEIAPVAPEFERHPGELRDSAHREPGHSDIGAAAVVDARDEDGEYYAAHVEYGHRMKDGRHVPAKPAFWPLYQVMKSRMKARISRAMGQVIKGERA